MSNKFLHRCQVIDSRVEKSDFSPTKLWKLDGIKPIKLLNKSKDVLRFPSLRLTRKLPPLLTSDDLSDSLPNLSSKPSGRTNCWGAISMKAASVKSFSKKLACPSSNLLLSFRRQILAREVNSLIKHHLATCDFCYCELPLLAFYTPPRRGDGRVPELPINLRLLAESILGRGQAEATGENFNDV